MYSVLKNVRVAGVAVCSPSHIRRISDELASARVGPGTVQAMTKVVGLDTRYVAKRSTTALDLCVSASRKLLESLEIDRNTIDVIVSVTQTPDFMGLSNAALLQAQLHLSVNCACFDVGLGCSGYVYGLWLASMIISSGTARSVLLTAGGTLSRHFAADDIQSAVQFGDAGSATLLVRSDGDSELWFLLRTDGNRSDVSPQSQERTSGAESSSRGALLMDGNRLYGASVECETSAIRDLLRLTGTPIESVDHFFFHQSNRFAIRSMCTSLGIPVEKAPYVVLRKYANQSSASIPMVMVEMGEQLAAKDLTRILLSGFWTGLSWTSALLEVSGVAASHHYI